MPSGYCGARCEGREAGVDREGTRGHGDTGTRGEAKMHGRDAVAPLPNLIQGTWGTPLRGQGDKWARWQGERVRSTRGDTVTWGHGDKG